MNQKKNATIDQITSQNVSDCPPTDEHAARNRLDAEMTSAGPRQRPMSNVPKRDCTVAVLLKIT
jgi:hypothetical protein